MKTLISLMILLAHLSCIKGTQTSYELATVKLQGDLDPRTDKNQSVLTVESAGKESTYKLSELENASFQIGPSTFSVVLRDTQGVIFARTLAPNSPCPPTRADLKPGTNDIVIDACEDVGGGSDVADGNVTINVIKIGQANAISVEDVVSSLKQNGHTSLDGKKLRIGPFAKWIFVATLQNVQGQSELSFEEGKSFGVNCLLEDLTPLKPQTTPRVFLTGTVVNLEINERYTRLNLTSCSISAE